MTLILFCCCNLYPADKVTQTFQSKLQTIDRIFCCFAVVAICTLLTRLPRFFRANFRHDANSLCSLRFVPGVIGDLNSLRADRPLQFHDTHGDNIALSHNKTRSRRAESFCKGICFSNRPIAIMEKVMSGGFSFVFLASWQQFLLLKIEVEQGSVNWICSVISVSRCNMWSMESLLNSSLCFNAQKKETW